MQKPVIKYWASAGIKVSNFIYSNVLKTVFVLHVKKKKNPYLEVPRNIIPRRLDRNDALFLLERSCFLIS